MPFDAHAEDTIVDGAQHTEKLEKDPALWPVYLGVALLIAAWGGSVATFGLPGLFIPPLMMVPVVMLVLIRLAWG